MRLLAIFLFLVTTLTSFGRIGEDYSQCQARYGQVYIKYDGDHERQYALFGKSIFKISVTIWKNTVHQIGYVKEGDFSDAEIAYILKANGGDKRWRQMSESRWITKDGALRAVMDDNGNMNILTSEYGHHYWEGQSKQVQNTELEHLRGL
jgi:hypothetical protein